MSPDLTALHAPFHGRRSQRVAYGVAAAQAVVLLAAMTGLGEGLTWLDRAGFVLVAGAVAWFLSRLGGVAAWPSQEGIVVRNIFVTTRLTWEQVEKVNFGGGDPWVTLDLVGTAGEDRLAVMAIQRADGVWGRAEANRLATLVALHRR
ncbi:PH domain-containing protein [Spongisporangium articulatum]|uniref:PH domain-containing protein n=1 Tax=Spongisporangium articulatum TaxID=3362603 RepID=A0ABW8ARE1_9ACTN